MELLVAGAIILFTILPNGATVIQESLSISPTPTPRILEKISPTPTKTPTGPIIHSVKTGETMETIAKKYYESSKHWTTLWNDNEFIENPALINAGLELKIRRNKPIANEPLNEELATIYEEILNPSPAPLPKETSLPQRQALPAGSFENTYKDAEGKYGVPWQILFGLHMVETGLRDGPIGNGSGPQGPLQFMPGTWAIYGVDGNGDGVADINNAIDAIHGAANYLSAHGGVEQGLRSYGKVYDKVMNVARQRGYGG